MSSAQNDVENTLDDLAKESIETENSKPQQTEDEKSESLEKPKITSFSESVKIKESQTDFQKNIEDFKHQKPDTMSKSFLSDISTEKKSSHSLIWIFFIAIIGLSVFLINQYYSNLPKTNIILNQVTNPSPVAAAFSLDIYAPDDELVVFDPKLTLTGKTNNSNSVLINSNDFDYGFEASSSGNFETNFDLKPGLNLIQISAFDRNGNSKTVNRSIFYSEDKL